MANNRPPFIKGKKVTAPNMTRHDSYSCALDLLAFTNHGEASINWEGKGVEEDTVYLAYQELKGNKTLSNELKKQYRSSAKINPPKYVPSC
ncbi:hypothetical protein HA142_06075 [Prochlorococcus marinus str. XMU1401]|uniref:Uncharacterized protein n=1 Tax=Prochlorococcus marinus str. XMU1401 TaxID=2052594 RepID=A0A8I1X3Z6_PROMR|nr:hypothetical protein [Prochlorococcus marinus]MBO8223076.1 hypothetical protein [Prochlorococcus marinus str. XMU1401]